MKKLAEEQNNSRKDAKTQRAAKQTKEFSFALLCVSAPLREIVHFFTASTAWVNGLFPAPSPERAIYRTDRSVPQIEMEVPLGR